MTHMLLVGWTGYDESAAVLRLVRAVEELKTVEVGERPRLRERIAHLSADLARVLTRTGREHLASVLLPDEPPEA